MKKLVVFMVFTAVLAMGQAWAAQEYIDVYPCMPGCCVFDCVSIDAECGWCCDSSSPLHIEFLDANDNLLGTGSFTNWCCDEVAARLDREVDSNQVCRIRLLKDVESCCINWVAIRVLCSNPCKFPKWKRVYKGDLWCWQTVPVAKPVPAPLPEPTPTEAPTPVPEEETTPEPQPEKSYDYFPPQAEKEEVISVEGRG